LSIYPVCFDRASVFGRFLGWISWIFLCFQIGSLKGGRSNVKDGHEEADMSYDDGED
jgi:hypothetical protein